MQEQKKVTNSERTHKSLLVSMEVLGWMLPTFSTVLEKILLIDTFREEKTRF